jgi:hypothetical protein
VLVDRFKFRVLMRNLNSGRWRQRLKASHDSQQVCRF